MKSFRRELTFNTRTRRAFINITPQIEDCLYDSGIKEGLLLCNPMHITASVFINDDEAGLHQRLLEVFLKKAWPRSYFTSNTITTATRTTRDVATSNERLRVAK